MVAPWRVDDAVVRRQNNVKEWASMSMPELLAMASHGQDRVIPHVPQTALSVEELN